MYGLEAGKIEISRSAFDKISAILYRQAGIHLNEGKHELVKSRLNKRLCATGSCGFEDYIDYVEHDTSGRELAEMIDILTTNTTFFFRESQHFDFLRERIIPDLAARGGKIRIWSAGCSTGEEPYTISIVLREGLANIDLLDVRILATDISSRVLATARNGVYTQEKLNGLTKATLLNHFSPVRDSEPPAWRVQPSLSGLTKFAKLNLMEPWPMQGPFQVIFCRNVMIYFDKPTQAKLVSRFWELLEPGGYLFVGHSESLTTTSHDFQYVKPAIYRK